MIRKQVETVLPTKWGDFRMIAYAEEEIYGPHFALVSPKLNPDKPVLVRLHSECVTGDLFGSKRCDCGDQLKESLRLTSLEGGVVLYLRQEGRGIGILNKLKAYNLQDEGLNTKEANLHLGFEADSRTYEDAVTILEDLKIREIRLLTNNPSKLMAFKESDVKVVERVPIIIAPTDENREYLLTKEKEMGHFLDMNNDLE